MEVFYAPAFVRQYAALPEKLQEEARERIFDFCDQKQHKRLKVHKLKGRLTGRFSFSVNFQTRITFSYLNKQSAILLAIGDHEVYDR